MMVSTSPRCRASCAKKFALRGSIIVHARKYSPCTLKTPQNRRFYACWANYFAEMPLEGPCWESFFAPTGTAPVLDAAPRTSGWLRWGFCSIRNWLPACRRRVTPLMTPFPPIGDGETVMFDVCPAVSHAIPLWLFQDLNWRRWNCNDSGGC